MRVRARQDAIGSLGSTHCNDLLLAVATIGTTFGLATITARRRKKRRAHRALLLGFLCGLATGAIRRERRGDIGSFAARTLTLVSPHLRTAMWPAGRRHRLWLRTINSRTGSFIPLRLLCRLTSIPTSEHRLRHQQTR